jgi:uncharacterized membrane protein
LVRLFSSV